MNAGPYRTPPARPVIPWRCRAAEGFRVLSARIRLPFLHRWQETSRKLETFPGVKGPYPILRCQLVCTGCGAHGMREHLPAPEELRDALARVVAEWMGTALDAAKIHQAAIGRGRPHKK